MQEDWKMEIEAMFDDIRVKEKVRRCFFFFIFLCPNGQLWKSGGQRLLVANRWWFSKTS